MTRVFSLVAAALLMVSCATKPPVQEMAEARSAIERAHQLENGNDRASSVLKSAEESLKEAAEAIDNKHYDMARRKAVEAKRKAQIAARIKSGSSDQ